MRPTRGTRMTHVITRVMPCVRAFFMHVFVLCSSAMRRGNHVLGGVGQRQHLLILFLKP